MGTRLMTKFIAVLEGDAVYGDLREVDQLPSALLDRLEHYFLTYKQAPGVDRPQVEIVDTYGRHEAYDVIRRSQADYEAEFGEIKRTKEILASSHPKR